MTISALTWTEFFGGISLLFLGGELLVRGAVAFAKKLGVSPLLIGASFVAFGTSAPELVVSIGAAARGVVDIAIGLKDKKSDFGKLTSDLYRSLQIGLQKRGIVFIDGSRPVSVKYKSNSVTPVIVEETHVEDYMDDTPQPNNFMN